MGIGMIPIWVVVVVVVAVRGEINYLQAWDVSEPIEEGSSIYNGEYYLNVVDLSYTFVVNHTDSTAEGRFKAMTQFEYDLFGAPSGLSDMEGVDVVLGNNYELTSTQLASLVYVFVYNDNTTEIVQYNILPIHFYLNVKQCSKDTLRFHMYSHIKTMSPIYGQVEILNTNSNSMCSSGSLVGPVSFNKTVCGIAYDISALILYNVDPVFLSQENSQMFNLTCRQDFTGVDVEHQVTDVSVEIDEVQNAFDSAYLIDFKIVDPNDDDAELTNAYIGAPVKMIVGLNAQYRADFDIRVDNCQLNNVDIYIGGQGPTTPLFNEFLEEQEDVYASVYNLFRVNSNTKELQLDYTCVVTTCLNECPPAAGAEGEGGEGGEGEFDYYEGGEGGFRRRKKRGVIPFISSGLPALVNAKVPLMRKAVHITAHI